MTKYIKTEHSYKLSKPEPLDTRLVVNSIEERDALVTNGEVYDSMEVYVRNDKKYKYNGSTWVDADYQTKIDECIKKTDECIKKTDGVNSLSINSTEQQYANAKATYLHIEERINAIQSAKKVWNKPLLNLDTTELNTVYYYQTGDNAWINKLWIPPTQDYGPGVYAYFDGIKWLTFDVTDVSVPALSQKDVYKFYVLYNEKYSRCQARSVEIATGTDSAIGGWTNIITRDEKPEGAIEVIEERYDRLGVWYKTIYLGEDKTNCFDITVPVSQDETGHLTTDDISTIIDENSTNLTIPTSRAVYEKIKNITIPSTEPITKSTGSIWLV